VTSASTGAGGDQAAFSWASLCSQQMVVEWDLPNVRPVARRPNPSGRTFKAAPTITEDVAL